MDSRYHEFLAGELAQIKAQGLWKEEWPILGPQGPQIRVEGRAEPVLNFCANNYLGLSGHPELLAAAHATLNEWGYGLSSVRFICGTQALHLELEKRVAAFLGMQDAILYAACFDANGGVFEPLLGPDDTILTDRLNHASIIDGVRLCKAKRQVYENADMRDLDAKLREAGSARFRLIVTDGVFSMDGTIAPLADICELADKHKALVLVDDSHATGFMGKTGRGTPEHCGVRRAHRHPDHDVREGSGRRFGRLHCLEPGHHRSDAPAQPAVPVLEHAAAHGRGRDAAGPRARLAEHRAARPARIEYQVVSRADERRGFRDQARRPPDCSHHVHALCARTTRRSRSASPARSWTRAST